MSMIVLAIGAAHALPPIIGASMTKSSVGLWVGVVVALVLALATGNPIFIAMDLMGIALGIWIALAIVGSSRQSAS